MYCAWLIGTLACAPLGAQLSDRGRDVAPAAQPEVPRDTLGRSSPRGTVLGFLGAAQKGNMPVAARYLNTRLRGDAAQTLAQQLFTVLDKRLHARLLELSASPEGSLTALSADQDLIGAIPSAEGDVDVLVERVTRDDKVATVWLFSRQTLERIPELYAEVDEIRVDALLPPFLLNTRVAGVALFNWVGLFLGLPAVYFGTVLLSRLLGLLVGVVHRRVWSEPGARNPDILPAPIRLALVALIIHQVLSEVALPLLPRQLWSAMASLIAIAAGIWCMIALSGRIEAHINARLARAGRISATSAVRLGRRVIGFLIVLIGLLAALHRLGFSPVAALAGLGIGGVALALAAQKTLENVLGGLSIIFAESVGVGDVLQIGATLGTVEEIGLRSTRIRTYERSVVSIPNGQLAVQSLENLSCRDKFWFHPEVRLSYDTTAGQMRSILNDLGGLLAGHPRVGSDPAYVRFVRFGAFSLELEIFAYVLTSDRYEFLQISEELLLRIMEIVAAAGARIAMQPPVLVDPKAR